METTRFDSLAKVVAAGGTRRRFVTGLALVGIGGAVLRPRLGNAHDIGDCIILSCPSGSKSVCTYNEEDVCISCKCVKQRANGITGGGVLAVGSGDVNFSLLGTRQPDPALANAFLVQGHLRWTDAAWEGAGLTLQSLQIAGYGPMKDVANGRELIGWLQASAVEAVVPFLLQATVAGEGATEPATVNLFVGDAVPADVATGATAVSTGFSYRADGMLTSGDLSLLDLGIGGEEVPATNG